MGIGKTLAGILLVGAIGTGGYLVGKGAGADKDYSIKRDKTEVYLLDKTSGKTLEIQKFGGELIVGNRTDILQMYDDATMKWAVDNYQSAKNTSIDNKVEDKRTEKQ